LFYAGDLPVSDPPDCGNTGAAVPQNRQGRNYRTAAAVIKKPAAQEIEPFNKKEKM
jgi:hypothetical protein